MRPIRRAVGSRSPGWRSISATRARGPSGAAYSWEVKVHHSHARVLVAEDDCVRGKPPIGGMPGCLDRAILDPGISIDARAACS
jgi:hypothetical protein